MHICIYVYGVCWIDAMLLKTVKASELKLGPFEHTQSISKPPARSVYVGNIINYFVYLPAPFPRGL